MDYQSNSIKELASALSQAQAEYPAIGKNRDGRFKYVDKNHIKKVVAPVLKKHGLAVNGGTRIRDGREVFCMTLTHSSGEYMMYESLFNLEQSNNRSQDQERGSSMTYISRYLYREILGITIEDDLEDDDTGAGVQQLVSPEQVQQLQQLSPGMQQSILGFNKVASFEKLTMKQYNNFKTNYNKRK